ncbi:MAG: hypothetical protein U1F55_00685 [Chitinivorax sp.]
MESQTLADAGQCHPLALTLAAAPGHSLAAAIAAALTQCGSSAAALQQESEKRARQRHARPCIRKAKCGSARRIGWLKPA